MVLSRRRGAGLAALLLVLAASARAHALDIASVNGMDQARFTETFGAVFEKSPWVAKAAWAMRPFADVVALHAGMVAIVKDAPLPAQLALLRGHPDLAGTEAHAGTMTASSMSEQSGAGLDALSRKEIAEIAKLNEAHRAKFGFPFIIAVRGKTKSEIMTAFRERLGDDTQTEYADDLRNVYTIARLRLDKLFAAK